MLGLVAKKVIKWVRMVNNLGRFRLLNCFWFCPSRVRKTSGFLFCASCALITWPPFLIIPFVFTLLFLLLITHFSQENYAHTFYYTKGSYYLSDPVSNP